MATWDSGPFGNDTASDFEGVLDEAALEECEVLIRGALKMAADPADSPDTSGDERAVAAATIVAAQCPDGELTCLNYGPSQPLPELPQSPERLPSILWSKWPPSRPDSPSLGTTLKTAKAPRQDLPSRRPCLFGSSTRGSPLRHPGDHQKSREGKMDQSSILRG
ncbi:DUF4259 domain-containing protein [Streptomyces sp. NPDC090080]|uniref:DUF4259 domain-containing protein n=1 Tax=Streptomyces sp. NPDC090080 TaxID=3365939 RepID=UPI00380762FB